MPTMKDTPVRHDQPENHLITDLVWFIGTQLLVLGALFCFTWVGWKLLFDHHRLVWLPKMAPTSVR